MTLVGWYIALCQSRNKKTNEKPHWLCGAIKQPSMRSAQWVCNFAHFARELDRTTGTTYQFFVFNKQNTHICVYTYIHCTHKKTAAHAIHCTQQNGTKRHRDRVVPSGVVPSGMPQPTQTKPRQKWTRSSQRLEMGLIAWSRKQGRRLTDQPPVRRHRTIRSICTLAQQDAAVAARRLPGSTACMISGCWGLPVCKNAATAHSFRLRAVQSLFLCRHWISPGDGLAIQISRLVAGPFLLCCFHCAVCVGLSKREGAHLLTKITTVVQYSLEPPQGE